MSEIQVFMVHHVTTAANAEKILWNSFTENDMDTGCLGKGIYFYENNLTLAYEYGLNKYATSDLEVIESEIVVEADDILDVSQPDSKGAKIFHKYCDHFQKAVRNLKVAIKSSRKDFDCAIIEKICENEGFKMVRGFAHVNPDKAGDRLYVSGIPNAAGICVKDSSIIIQSRGRFRS